MSLRIARFLIPMYGPAAACKKDWESNFNDIMQVALGQHRMVKRLALNPILTPIF